MRRRAECQDGIWETLMLQGSAEESGQVSKPEKTRDRREKLREPGGKNFKTDIMCIFSNAAE